MARIARRGAAASRSARAGPAAEQAGDPAGDQLERRSRAELGDAQGVGDRGHDERCVGKVGERDERDCRAGPGDACRDLEREPRFADSARAGEGY